MAIKSFRRGSSQGGFDLIELIVAIAIIVLITASLLMNYNRFSSGVVLDNLTSDVALEIRTAQGSALGSRQIAAGGERGYGVHFELATPGGYVQYVDLPDFGVPALGDFLFRVGAGCGSPIGLTGVGDTECVDQRLLMPGYRISNITGVEGVNNFPTTFLDVTFTRPNPDAEIRGDDGAGVAKNFSSATITLIAPKGNTRTIRVTNTGQISILSNP